ARTRGPRRRQPAERAAHGPRAVRGLSRVAGKRVGPPAVPCPAADDRSAPAADGRPARTRTGDGLRAGLQACPFFLQYLANPRQFRSKRPATSYACASATFILRVSSRRS